MPRGRHRDDEDEGDPAGPGPAAPFGASTKVTPAGPVDGNDVFSPEAAAILQRRWRDSAAALRETASTLKGLGSSNLRWGVQPTEYLQMLSLPSGRIVERLFEAAAGLNFTNAVLFQATIQVFFNPPRSIVAHLSRPDTLTGKGAIAFVFINGLLVIIAGCNTTMVGWFVSHVSSLRDDLVYRWLARAKYITIDKLSFLYVLCFMLIIVMVEIYANITFCDYGARRVAYIFNFTMGFVAIVLPASFLRSMHPINPLYWLGYSVYSIFFFPLAGRTNLHKPKLEAAVLYASELAADMESIAARIERDAAHRAEAAKSAPWASESAKDPADSKSGHGQAPDWRAVETGAAAAPSEGRGSGEPLKERPWHDGVAALRQVAAELRDLRVNSLTSGAQPTFLAQMLTLPKGRIVERIIESATSLNFVNALLFSCVIQVFFALPDLILDALKGSPPYEARHARVATAFVFLNGATVVILGCATTLVSWFTINVSVVRDDMVQRWLEKARYITLDKYNTLYIVSYFDILIMMCLFAYTLFSTTGSPGVAWGFCLAICLVTVALFSSFLRISYHLNPFYWLGYSAYAYTFFPFAGLRTPLNRGAVAAAEEYARELAKDLDDMANIYEYEKLHEERERARRAAAR